MKPTLAILAAVLLLAGCGHASAPKDPFVGTWATSMGDRVVISRQSRDYAAVASRYGGRDALRVVFSRQANRLVAVAPMVVSGISFKPGADIEPSGLLYFSLFGKNEMLSKVSDSTVIPTPSPS